MTKFVDKDSPNIADAPTVRAETQRPPVRVALLISVKENVGLGHSAARNTPARHRQGARSTLLAEYGVREDDRVDAVSRGSRRIGDSVIVAQPGQDGSPQ